MARLQQGEYFLPAMLADREVTKYINRVSVPWNNVYRTIKIIIIVDVLQSFVKIACERVIRISRN